MLADLGNHGRARDVVEETRDVRTRKPEHAIVEGLLNLGETVRHTPIRHAADTRRHFEDLPNVAAFVLQAVEEGALNDPVLDAGHDDGALAVAARLLLEHAFLRVELELAAMQPGLGLRLFA